MKFEQDDLEGMMWTEDTMPISSGKSRIIYPIGEHHTIPEWKTYWVARKARLATIQEIYSEFQKVGFRQQARDILTGTTIGYSEDHSRLNVYHGSSIKTFDNPYFEKTPLTTCYQTAPELMNILFGTFDAPRTVLKMWQYYFQDEKEPLVTTVIDNPKEGNARSVALITQINNSAISLIWAGEMYAASSFGMKDLTRRAPAKKRVK